MKLTLCAICALGMMVINIGCTVQGERVAASGLVTIQYIGPERFTDFSIHGRDVRSSASVFTQEVTRTLEPVMAQRFPGYLLTLRFTNIDLGGRRTSVGASSVRVVRNRTPASGSQRLVDTGHTSSSRNRSGSLNNETRMLRGWLQLLSVPR